MRMRRLKIGIVVALALVLGIVPMVPSGAQILPDVRGVVSCSPADAEGNRVCGFALFWIVTGVPGTNNVEVAFMCQAIGRNSAVSAHVLPIDQDGCQLRKGPEGTAAADMTVIVKEAPGIGEPKATAETVEQTISSGFFGACFKVGATFLSGRHGTHTDCGLEALEPQDLLVAFGP